MGRMGMRRVGLVRRKEESMCAKALGQVPTRDPSSFPSFPD